MLKDNAKISTIVKFTLKNLFEWTWDGEGGGLKPKSIFGAFSMILSNTSAGKTVSFNRNRIIIDSKVTHLFLHFLLQRFSVMWSLNEEVNWRNVELFSFVAADILFNLVLSELCNSNAE